MIGLIFGETNFPKYILKKVKNEHAKLNTSLKLSKSLKSNKVINFRVF